MSVLRAPRKISISLVAGLSLTASFIVHIAADDLPADPLYTIFLLLYIGACFSVLAYLLLRSVLRYLRTFSRHAQAAWIVGAALVGALAMVVIPIDASPWVWSELTITPLNLRDPAARGSEVWLLRASVNGRPLPLAVFEHDGSWKWRDNGELVALTGTTSPAHWRGWVRGALTLTLLRHPWSGLVQVTFNGQMHDINLYADPASAHVMTLTPSLDVFGWTQYVVFGLAHWISLSVLALGVTVSIAR